jgi:hypothetical protein
VALSAKVSIVLAIAVAAITTAGTARAQTDAPAVVPVQISATQQGAYIQLRGPRGEIPCGERCALQLPQGQYRVLVRDREGYTSAQKLTLLGPGNIVVSPANHGDKVLGIGLFVGGVVATAAGAVMLYLAILDTFITDLGGCSDCSGLPKWTWYAGGASLAAGATMGTIGIIMWQTNAHAAIGMRPLGAPPLPPSGLRLTPAAGRQWAGLALTARF